MVNTDFSLKQALALKVGEGSEWQVDGKWWLTWKNPDGSLVSRPMTDEESLQARRYHAASEIRAPFRKMIEAVIKVLPDGPMRTAHVQALISVMKDIEIVAAAQVLKE
jgi:hypothetical protein